jgi:hypothetical protein
MDAMRRALLFSLVFLGLAPAAQAKPRAVLVTCDRNHQAAVFEGRMGTVRGTDRMQMRFRLYVTEPEMTGWHRVAAPGRSRYVYTRRVEALLAPASYRVQIRFRWLDADGDTLKTARATSRTCRQPDPRPDLRVDGIEVRPSGKPGKRRYAITLWNAGRSEADASSLLLGIGDRSPLSAPVPAIAAHKRAVVIVTGRRCTAGEQLTVTADADDVVDESHEDANVLSVACPGLSG